MTKSIIEFLQTTNLKYVVVRTQFEGNKYQYVEQPYILVMMLESHKINYNIIEVSTYWISEYSQNVSYFWQREILTYSL